uniref:Transposase Tc1-like domain-containing protein n=1 Tax=Oncorhynchus tshawytscha TaxID=74940 RepID=A0AAZ3Q6J6_ONCTS
NRYGLGYNRYGLGYNRYGLGYIRYGPGYNRYGLGYNRYGLGYNRYGLGYNRYGLGYIRYGPGYNRYGLGYFRYGPGYKRYSEVYRYSEVVGHTRSQNRTAECRRVTLTADFQTVSGCNFNTRTVRRELHEMGFHGRAAAHKPKITMRSAKRQLVWCKACHHRTPCSLE